MNSTIIDEAVERLARQLPLQARQRALTPQLRGLHQSVIESLVRQGRPPSDEEIVSMVGADQADAAVRRLGGDDLVVLSKDRRSIVGAYPVTAEKTPHEVHVSGHLIYAMCALDAVSVAPMFGMPVEICSHCRVTGEFVCIKQDRERVLEATPAGVRVGVRWQMPSGDHAAHSMCREMVFLRDDPAAAEWSRGDRRNHSVFTLEEAIEFGTRTFRPLLERAH